MPLQLPIKVGKRYFTRNMQEVEIYSTGNGGSYPIHGRIRLKDGSGWEVMSWTEHGFLSVDGRESDDDLVYEEVLL